MLYVPAWTDDPQFTSVDFKKVKQVRMKGEKKEEEKHNFWCFTIPFDDIPFQLKFVVFWLTWLVVVDVSKQEEDDTEGGESSPPCEQEHQDYRDDRSKQSRPFTVVMKRWSPA